jgi:hypothetical protein
MITKEQIDLKFKKMTPPVLEFLMTVARNGKKFDIDQLRSFNPVLKKSGDRALRELHNLKVIQYDKEQNKGIYYLKSDIWDLQILLNQANRGYVMREIESQMSLFKDLENG